LATRTGVVTVVNIKGVVFCDALQPGGLAATFSKDMLLQLMVVVSLLQSYQVYVLTPLKNGTSNLTMPLEQDIDQLKTPGFIALKSYTVESSPYSSSF
jgi:hypothetical protein